MSKIVFFSIPAHGHTNPTIEVVRELVDRGNEVLYYSFNDFKTKIERAGARCICCDEYLPKLRPEDEKKIGKDTNIEGLGNIPDNFQVKNNVDQISVLRNTDVFITHCGMNSVNESLYYGIPMVLFSQHSEQMMVANRVNDLGAGIMLNKNKAKCIKEKVIQVINNNEYKEKANKLARSFHNSGGIKKAADVILKDIYDSRKIN